MGMEKLRDQLIKELEDECFSIWTKNKSKHMDHWARYIRRGPKVDEELGASVPTFHDRFVDPFSIPSINEKWNLLFKEIISCEKTPNRLS